MKKNLSILLVFAAITLMTGCMREQEPVNMGLNAQILEIDQAGQLLYISDEPESQVFGERLAIDCGSLIETGSVIYVNYETQEVTQINFSDLAPGDHIMINASSSQLSAQPPIQVEQIQLGTQRLNETP